MNSPLRLLLVDDHQLLIDGLKALLANDDRFIIAGESLRCKDALELVKHTTIDIIITDINMPEMDGIAFTSAIRRFNPDVKILALSMYGEKSTIVQMLDAGVNGYMLKNTGRDELVNALLHIASGKKFFSEEVAAELNRPDPIDQYRELLTSREREILKYVAQGKSHTEIGELLFISPRTVDTHRTNMMRKMEVNSIAELIKVAIQLKLVE
jgi:DNA-binding NarL/FixJ family response regulator